MKQSQGKNKMAKDNTLLIIGIVVLGLMWMNQQGGIPTPPPPSGGGEINLCTVVEPSASFTGQRMFVEGTSLTAEYVRVIKDGDARKDLGQIILNSGTLNTAPGAVYNLYYGENSSTYYTRPEKYTAPCQDAVDDKIGVLCTIDTTPTITVKDEHGNVQTNGTTTNCQAIAASDSVDMSIKVKVSADQCYGNQHSGKTNAICLKYNSTALQKVELDTNSLSVPYTVSNTQAATTYEIDCFELALLKDLGSQELTLSITAGSGEPGAGNISIFLDDMAFDLDADTLAEIWDFQDEDNNALGAAGITHADLCYS